MKIKEMFNKCKFKVQKHSPEILIGVGVVGMIGSTVLACKATLKINDVMDETQENLEKIETALEKVDKEKYSEEDAERDKHVIAVQTGVKIVKLYLPAIGLGIFSVACLVSSNRILQKRYAGLASAYTLLDKSYSNYRKNVIEKYGEEVDKEMRYGIKAETVTDEDGNETTQKVMEMDPNDPNSYSDYARFFDEASPYWEKDPEYNLTFLKAQQQFANDILVARGRIFLNEVYEMLGIPKTKAGQVVGWVYDPEHPVGDNYVDFGLFDLDRERVRRFVNGDERNILLDFNVDGNIWELM